MYRFAISAVLLEHLIFSFVSVSTVKHQNCNLHFHLHNHLIDTLSIYPVIFLFLCSSLGICSDLFSCQKWVGFFLFSVLLFAFLFAFSPPFYVSSLFHFFSPVAFRTPATFVHSHHFKLLSHMLPFTEHLPSTDFQSTDACSLSVMATTALNETYRFPSCNSCTNAWHVLPGESLSTLNFLAFVESVKKSDRLQLWQLF